MKQIYLDNAGKLSYKESLNKRNFLFRKKTSFNKEKLNLRKGKPKSVHCLKRLK